MRFPGYHRFGCLLASLIFAPTLAVAQRTDVFYANGAEIVKGVLFTPAGRGPFPALLAIHAVFGLDDWTKEQATRLSDAGYVVLAVDLYGGKVANGLDDAGVLLRRIPTGGAQRELLAGLAFLRAQPNVSRDRLGSIGWCMGGTWAFRLASLDPLLKVAVVRYGHLSDDPKVLTQLNARILGIFGGKDSSIPVADVHRFAHHMLVLGKPADIIIYPEAGHAFETPEHLHTFGSAYHGYRPQDTADAWTRTIAFLDASLKSPRHAPNGKH